MTMNKAATFISTLFLGRELAHRAHLRTDSYARHVALNDFYNEIVDLADEFAEVFQGMNGVIGDIPISDSGVSTDIIKILESQSKWIESARDHFNAPSERPLQNIIDTILALYYRTLYKLKTFE